MNGAVRLNPEHPGKHPRAGTADVLYTLFFRSPRSEFGIYAAALCVAMLYSSIKIFLLSTSEVAAAYEGGLVAVIVLFVFVAGYVILNVRLSNSSEDTGRAETESPEPQSASDLNLSNADLIGLVAQVADAFVQASERQTYTLTKEFNRSLDHLAQLVNEPLAQVSKAFAQASDRQTNALTYEVNRSLESFTRALEQSIARMNEASSESLGHEWDNVLVAVRDQILRALPDIAATLASAVESAVRERTDPIIEELKDRRGGRNLTDISLVSVESEPAGESSIGRRLVFWDLTSLGRLVGQPGPETPIVGLVQTRTPLADALLRRDTCVWLPDPAHDAGFYWLLMYCSRTREDDASLREWLRAVLSSSETLVHRVRSRSSENPFR